MTAAERGTILTVCTGNICRSPLIAAGLEARLGADSLVTSAGTLAEDGATSPTEMVAAADGAHLDLRAHRARRLNRQMIADADIIVAAAREHRRAVAELQPRAARYSFTLPELVRIIPLVTDDDRAALPGTSRADRVRSAVRLLGSIRGQALPPAVPEDDDIEDPYGRSNAAYARSVTQTVRALDLLGPFFGELR